MCENHSGALPSMGTGDQWCRHRNMGAWTPWGGMFGKGCRLQEVCTPAPHDAMRLPPKHLPTAPVTCLYLLRA